MNKSKNNPDSISWMNQNCVQVVLVLVLGRRFVIRKNRKFNISSDQSEN